MDGDLRYAAVRDYLEAQHELVRAERSARQAGVARQARVAHAGWGSGVVSVVGFLTNRVNRRSAST